MLGSTQLLLAATAALSCFAPLTSALPALDRFDMYYGADAAADLTPGDVLAFDELEQALARMPQLVKPHTPIAPISMFERMQAAVNFPIGSGSPRADRFARDLSKRSGGAAQSRSERIKRQAASSCLDSTATDETINSLFYYGGEGTKVSLCPGANLKITNAIFMYAANQELNTLGEHCALGDEYVHD